MAPTLQIHHETLDVGCAIWTLDPTPDLDPLRQHMETERTTCGEGDVPWNGLYRNAQGDRLQGVFAIKDETGNDDMIDSIRESCHFLATY